MKINIETNNDNGIYEERANTVKNKLYDIAIKHRKTIVGIDDMSIIVNFLKYDEEDLNTDIFENKVNVICPKLIKNFESNIRIPLIINVDSGNLPIYDVMKLRMTKRDYSLNKISFEDLSNIIYFSCGKRGEMSAYNTNSFPLRFFPSAGGLQSTDLFVISNNVESLDNGMYYYDYEDNSLVLTQKGYMRNKVLDCCIEQNFMEDASLVFVLVSNLNRIKWKYGEKSYRFAHVDTGIVAQNIHLVATSNKLRSCMIAGFDDDKINKLLMIDGEMEFASLIISIGTSPWNIFN